MKKIAWFIILFLSFSNPILLAQEVNNFSAQITEEEYEMYSCQFSRKSGEGNKPIVVMQKVCFNYIVSSQKEEYTSRLKRELGDKISDSLINDFFAINTKPATLENKFSNVILIPEAEEREIFGIREGRWERFSLKYPGVTPYIFRYSRVAFNRDKTKALLFRETLCRLGGSGQFLLFKKENDVWVCEGGLIAFIG